MKAYKEGKLLKASELNAGIMRPQESRTDSLSYYQAGAGLSNGLRKNSVLTKSDNRSCFLRKTIPRKKCSARHSAWIPPEWMRHTRALWIRVSRSIASHLSFPASRTKPWTGDAASRPTKRSLRSCFRKIPKISSPTCKWECCCERREQMPKRKSYLKKAQQLFPQYVEPGNPYQLLGQDVSGIQPGRGRAG